MSEIRYTPIGVIHSPFRKRQEIPKEHTALEGVNGSVEVASEYAEGLKDIDGFSHLILVFHFHLSRDRPLTVKPYWDEETHGVFSTRSPDRPNPIGVSVVRLTKRVGDTLNVQGVDVVDGTPLLDIKPYLPDFDRKGAARAGWLEKHLTSRSKRP